MQNNTQFLSLGVLIAVLMLVGCATVAPPMPTEPGFILQKSVESVYQASLHALRSSGFTRMTTSRPVYIRAETPEMEMHRDQIGQTERVLYGIKGISVWCEPLNDGSTRLVIKHYYGAKQADADSLVAKIKELLR